MSSGFRQEDFSTNFSIGPYVKLSSAVAAILVDSLGRRTKILKEDHLKLLPSLILIDLVVSDEKIFE